MAKDGKQGDKGHQIKEMLHHIPFHQFIDSKFDFPLSIIGLFYQIGKFLSRKLSMYRVYIIAEIGSASMRAENHQMFLVAYEPTQQYNGKPICGLKFLSLLQKVTFLNLLVFLNIRSDLLF